MRKRESHFGAGVGIPYSRGASAEKCGRRFVYMIFLDSNHPTKLMSEHILLYTRLDNA
jgi:hypothetical protein